jgi:hypothetical protein
MVLCRIFIITIAFAINISAFNPFKNKKVEVYNNIDNSAVEEEVVTLRESLINLLSGKCAAYHINASVPDWLKNFNYKFRPGGSCEALSEISIADILIIVNYKRKSMYGLAGCKIVSNWVGYDLSGSSSFMGGGVGVGGTGSSSIGDSVIVNVTDGNPEWQYRSTVELDVYDCIKKEKLITLIRTHEASSDIKDDTQTFAENIGEIFDEIKDVMYRKSEYTKFKKILNDSTSVRSPMEINDRITASLIHVFSEVQDESLAKTISKTIVVDEYGTVSLTNSDSTDNVSVFDDLLTGIHLQRVVKPGDKAKFKPEFKIARYFDKILINGDYCSISAVRDSSEVWNILYHYLDDFIKHQNSFNADQRVAHVTFYIKPDGSVGNATMIKSINMESTGKKLLEEISGWNFGDKSHHNISESTQVEFVCTLSKDKNSVHMK